MIHLERIRTNEALLSVIEQLGFLAHPYGKNVSVIGDNPACVIDKQKNPTIEEGPVLIYVLSGFELHVDCANWDEQNFAPFHTWKGAVDSQELQLIIRKAGMKGALGMAGQNEFI